MCPAATMSTSATASAPAAAIARDNSRPLVLSGPSGSGKSTLLTRLFKEFPNAFGFSVSHTSRSPRPGEVNGVNYNFVTRSEFEALIQQGAFIEHAEFAKNLYGTSVQGVKQVVDQGRVCVLDIDMQGVKLIKKTSLRPWFIFIQPPSMTALEARLRGRGTEKEEAIADRLETARAELEYAQQPGAHDLVLVNDNLDETYKRLVAWIQERYTI
ncbi:P-loop containing nucleoside triphosphate hydrolase protein [Catenaria anguillulae PL171]|uniref:Guanylate kinase n=1 Tax=Catenaria anguillulae PL171 TaxID=765915 RepID=A0A1Y2HE84_9FUNG|nr:P-loop containing nucleoside triphosphate hydrolase protein [Catenaria anguillulae PL171]